MKNSSRRYSVGPRSIGAAGAGDAMLVAVELDVAEAQQLASRSGLARRSRPFTRASSSGTENGLTT